MRKIFLLKLVVAFFAMMIVSNFVWEELVDEQVYDCTDSGIGFLNLPGGDWPLVSVQHIIPKRPIGDPDNILVGWTLSELRCLAAATFTASLIASFLLARLPWFGEPRERQVKQAL